MRNIRLYTNYSGGNKNLVIRTKILESLAGCGTMVIFGVFCKIGALERNAY